MNKIITLQNDKASVFPFSPFLKKNENIWKSWLLSIFFSLIYVEKLNKDHGEINQSKPHNCPTFIIWIKFLNDKYAKKPSCVKILCFTADWKLFSRRNSSYILFLFILFFFGR